MHWFAILSQAQKEEQAVEDLRRRDFEVYWPYRLCKVGAGNKAEARTVKRSVLSRYFFLRTKRDQLSRVVDDRAKAMGVATIVSAQNQEPTPIPDQIMGELMARIGPNGKAFPHLPRRNKLLTYVGSQVKGKEGWPIWGLVGQISRIAGEDVAIKLLMFGSEREMVVPSDAVELLETG